MSGFTLRRVVSDVTRILEAIQAGQTQAAEELLPLVYDELRRIARAKMARERPGQTLQPTALVHEAWLRLGGDTQPAWQTRAHFFAAAAEAMRRILVERARQKSGPKRGGEMRRIDIDQVMEHSETTDHQLVMLDEALSELEGHDAQAAALRAGSRPNTRREDYAERGNTGRIAYAVATSSTD